MTSAALTLLQAKDKGRGFFLMVEAGRIDMVGAQQLTGETVMHHRLIMTHVMRHKLIKTLNGTFYQTRGI